MTIISIEGGKASGKSYLIEHLKKIYPEAIILPTKEEYKFDRENCPKPQDQSNGNFFLFRLLSKHFQADDKNKLYIFDRDYVSFLAFSYAHHIFSKNKKIHAERIKKINTLKKLDIIIEPDVRFICDCNYKLFLQRDKHRNKNTEKFWYKKKFANLVYTYYRKFAKKPNNCLLNPNFKIKDVIEILKQRNIK
jgi:thymidylate kinase